MGTCPLARPRLSWWQAGLTMALVAGGFFAGTQIRNELEIRQQLKIPSTRLHEVAIQLRKQESRRAALEAAVEELRRQVAALEREAAERQIAAARMNRRVSELRALAGLTPLEGPGVVVEMRDSSRPIQPGDDPNKTILHYTDIHGVINDLWAAGAEAVAVNGERLIGRTGINCVGTTILCNTKRIAPPYTVVAIGDPARLLAQLERPGGPVEVLRAFGFPLRLQRLERVTVPAYRGTTQFVIARPAGDDGP
ncbi:MAG: DUF881 domain-containing protein [Armatimonadota bacterium]|nr:DUF881 domain-containing protein [Armatimonadota bacterium]MDR7470571.1 DUF881 domain-containing protein [Armatimonadota bacterium]MDR7474157.1 DUF881 domain-containing protein [Armatimonadota bacterium]